MSFKQRCLSNTEKEYDCLIIQNPKSDAQNMGNVIKSNVENHHEHSFSFDNNVALNKENYLTYDKKVMAFQNINTSNPNVIEHPKIISPQPNVSMSSFKNMTSYVKNTFRKNKPSGRKNSYYSYSSHRRKEPFGSMGKYVSNSKGGRKKGTIRSERPFSVKSNNSSSQREGHAGVLSCDSVSIASLGMQEQNVSNLAAKNKEIKEELHKSRKNNGVLRTKLSKKEREIEKLRDDKLKLAEKVEKLERIREKDRRYIQQQELEIQNLHSQLRHPIKDETDEDLDKEELKVKLEQVIEVKMKYENIIKAMVEKPELKPILASILENN